MGCDYNSDRPYNFKLTLSNGYVSTGCGSYSSSSSHEIDVPYGYQIVGFQGQYDSSAIVNIAAMLRSNLGSS